MANDLGGASTHDLFLFLYYPFFSGVWPLWPQQWPCRICYWCSQLWAELSFSLLLTRLTHSSGCFCCCRWVVMMTSILPNLLVQNGDDPAQLITCCNFHIFHTQIFFQLFLQLLSKSSIFVLMNSELQESGQTRIVLAWAICVYMKHYQRILIFT